ncbi:hypothetical protein [Kutzneria sp. NPDC051319]|uniref:hypothetical protein n=1 Tax=Kutzneria sp. NPDC051319 TaxID=3155047 RepID=UPI00341D66CA
MRVLIAPQRAKQIVQRHGVPLFEQQKRQRQPLLRRTDIEFYAVEPRPHIAEEREPKPHAHARDVTAIGRRDRPTGRLPV